MSQKQLFFYLAFVCSVSYGQIGGKYTYQFLNLITSPRQAALGGKTITIYDEDTLDVEVHDTLNNENWIYVNN